MGNPYNGALQTPYYEVDDHPYHRENNGSFHGLVRLPLEVKCLARSRPRKFDSESNVRKIQKSTTNQGYWQCRSPSILSRFCSQGILTFLVFESIPARKFNSEFSPEKWPKHSSNHHFSVAMLNFCGVYIVIIIDKSISTDVYRNRY